jgi:hypothetical protein
MGLTAAYKDRSLAVAVTSTAGAFLPIPLSRCPSHLAPRFGLMGAKAGVRLLPNQRLMHDGFVWFYTKDIVSKFQLFDFSPTGILNIYFHHSLLSLCELRGQ